MINRGLVHIYTGDGKGKTTSAIGLVIRALGHNFKVCIVTLQKDPEKFGYGEFNVLKKLRNVKLLHFAKFCPYFEKNYPEEKVKEEILEALEFIKNEIFTNDFDLVVIDEILVCIREKLLDIEKLIELIKLKPANVELVLTGQANKSIVNRLKGLADYVSYIKKIKHPYDANIGRRRGVEY